MFWFWIPVLVASFLVLAGVLAALVAWGRDTGDRVEGETLYDAADASPSARRSAA